MKALLKTTLPVIMAVCVMTAAGQPQRGNRGQQRNVPTPEQQAEKVSETMAKELDLTDQQKKQIYDLELEAAKVRPNYRMRQNQERPSEEEMKEMQEWRNKHHAAVQEVLTPEQFEKWTTTRKERMRTFDNGQGQRRNEVLTKDSKACPCPYCDKAECPYNKKGTCPQCNKECPYKNKNKSKKQ